MALLEIEELRVGYGAVPVLQGISFEVMEGSTTVIFGLNGAGKTTTVNTIAGLLTPWSGRIVFDGETISGRSAPDIVERGVALCPEGRRVFANLTVRQNLELGAWTRRDGLARRLAEVIDYFPRLEERAEQTAGTLSGGEQQMLAIGRALMSGPRLLLIDEASLGLSPKLAASVFGIVRRINADGTTVVIVEQNAGVLPYADNALVLEKGSIAYAGAAAELGRSGALERAYLG